MENRVSIAVEPAYQPRRFQSGGVWDLGGCRFKVHLISYDPAKPPFSASPEIIKAARAYCAALAAEMDRASEHFGVGYIILHEGEAAENNWLLFDWWIPGGILCHTLSRALNATPTKFERMEGSSIACVWEEVSIGFERDQWVAKVLSGPRDIEAYLAAHLPEGLY
jgi:hypothetical protein